MVSTSRVLRRLMRSAFRGRVLDLWRAGVPFRMALGAARKERRDGTMMAEVSRRFALVSTMRLMAKRLSGVTPTGGAT